MAEKIEWYWIDQELAALFNSQGRPRTECRFMVGLLLLKHIYEMSDEDVLQHFNISQSGRWYRWRTDTLPIPRKAIQHNSANMHMIPADNAVESTLDDVREGHVVEIRGKLVWVDGDDGWSWKSSLKRTDTGAGACELIYVEEIRILTP